MLISPGLLLRRKMVINKLKKCNAISEGNAVTLKEAGMFYPKAFPKIIQNLIDLDVIKKTRDGKYFLS